MMSKSILRFTRTLIAFAMTSGALGFAAAAAQDEELPPAATSNRVQDGLTIRPELTERLRRPEQPARTTRGLSVAPVENIRGLNVVNTSPFDVFANAEDREVVRSASVKNTSWLDPEIPVCWESMNPAYAKGRTWVEGAIEASWDKAANIDFTGWQGCTEDSPGIRIDVREAGARVAALGRQLDGLANGMTLNFTFASWGTSCATSEATREFCIRALAVHEFGHALGLAHEDLRADREKTRDLCWADAQGPYPSFNITSYDPDSVMNYCSNDWNNNGRLTPLDIAGVRMIYGPFDDQTPATIDLHFNVAFDRMNNTPARPAPVTENLILTDTVPRQERSLTFCSNDNRLLDVSLTASLEPASTKINVTGKLEVFAASADCQSVGALLAEETIEETVLEPSIFGQLSEFKLQPGQDSFPKIEIGLVSQRTLGDESVVEACTNCEAASAEAVFATRPGEAQETQWVKQSAPSPLVVAANGGPWFNSTISVCWEDESSANAAARGWTEAAVRNTWEKVSAVDFTGWETCTGDDFSSIHIQVADTGPNVAQTGRMLAGMPGGMTLNFTFANWGQGCAAYLEYCIKALAVHEFGHALGLAHEHNRDDRTACETEPQGPLPSYIVTKYDPASVMNYCSEDWNNNGKLSPMDVFGIRALYGPFTEDDPMHIAQNGAITFTPAGDGDPIRHDISFDVYLSETANLFEKELSICNGDDLLVEVNSKTSLESGSLAPDIENHTRIYQTTNCAPGGALIDESHIIGNLPVPGDSLSAFSSDLFEFDEATGEFGRGVGGYLSPQRVLGRDVTPEDCASCVAAAEEARFGPETPPVSLSGANLHTTSTSIGPVAARSITAGAASPWPKDFNLDLEVCSRAVKAGPDFGTAPWSEANISRLCNATPTSDEPAKCYARIMNDGLDYGGGTVWNPANALNLCAGSDDSGATIACFSEKISAGSTWQTAIPACAAP